MYAGVRNKIGMVVAGVLLLGLASCGPAETAGGGDVDVTFVDDEGNTSIDDNALEEALEGTVAGELTTDEVTGIAYMREEEKLARDVYLALYDLWGLPIFQNIAASEQTHMDAVFTLIERYGLEDPAADRDGGEFVDGTLQALYDELVELGSRSLADGLKAGAAIEEIDILDLEERLSKTDQSDIQLVYNNLMKGSRNHLRAFVSTLARYQEEPYEPAYLPQQEYDGIVGSAIESGANGGGGRR
jgi:hypothetical protein